MTCLSLLMLLFSLTVYFGEGAASEGDFHAALNFAATLSCPTIFFCRNNKYAISTPSYEQYRGDGIAVRGLAYGIHTIRCDGNDVFAVYNATKFAREYALKNSAPVLIEAMTYRVGHHSTSDDATRYRTAAEVEKWSGSNNPIKRLRAHLTSKGLWDDAKEKQIWAEAKAGVLAAVKKAEAEVKPPIADLFNDVYDKDTWNITEQRRELAEHLAKYPNEYPLDKYKK
jgi:2-oxoisovalerate dehydrogenase E1 component alpha subunit